MSLSMHEFDAAGMTRDGRRFDLSQALVEARRCLRCYDAPCSGACPAHIDVPGFISRLADQNFAGSYELIVSANPLPAICGLVCPTQDLCEGACVLTRQNQRPIRVGALQHFVAANYQTCEPVGDIYPARRVAVIGAGPSGLSCAVELRRLGHSVTVFDRAAAPGGLAGQVIPMWRLPQESVDREILRLHELGIEFHMEYAIDAERAAELRREYDAVYVAVGLSSSAPLSLPGADLPGVIPALDFLRVARQAMRGEGSAPDMGERVVVLGGGNVALDAAAAALHLGASRAIVLYRRTLAEMPAWRSEYVEAASLGVEFRWLSTPRAIRRGKGPALIVEVQPMRLSAKENDDRRGVEPDPEAQPYDLTCDTVLTAVGQQLERDVAEALGIGVTARRTIQVTGDDGQTTHALIFAGGDAANGGSTVVQAVADGVRAAHTIHDRLAGRGER